MSYKDPIGGTEHMNNNHKNVDIESSDINQICAKYTFEDFFRFATPEEKKIVILTLAREAWKEQEEIIREIMK